MKNSSSLLTPAESAVARRWDLPLLAGAREHATSREGAPPTARQIDEVAAAAREEGFTQGRREGYLAGLAAGQAAVAQLTAVVDALARPLESLDAEVERQLLALAVELARELAQREIRRDPEALAGLARAAIKAITPPPRDVRLHLHPADVAVVRELLKDAGALPHCHFVPDDSLQRGDCRVTAEASTVNARMDARVAELAQALLGEQG